MAGRTMTMQVINALTGWKGYLAAAAIGAALIVAGAVAWSWRWSSGYDAGHAAALAEVQIQQAAIERGIESERARADAQYRGQVLARQQLEKNLAEAERQRVAAATRLRGLLKRYSDRTTHPATGAGPHAAGPDWIGIFGECVARAESLGRRLGQVGADAAEFADTVNGLQGYARAIQRAR